MEDVTLSIIVPIYNQEKYIKECIDSIVKQQLNSVEVILVDDGSTDKTKDICSDICKNNEKLKYVYQENKGLGPARNTGINIAQGKYLMFVDSDDAIIAGCIEKLISFAVNGNYDIVYFDELICDEKLNSKYVVATLPTMTCSVEKNIAMSNCYNPAHIWAKIYKKKLFENKLFENIWYEDMEIFPYLISKSDNIGYFKVPIYKYRQHQMTITHNDFDVRNEDVIKAWSHTLTLSKKEKDFEKILEKSIRLSIFEFIFFKKEFCGKYIDWYNETLLLDTEVSKNSNNIIFDMDNWQIINQARVYDLNNLIIFIKNLINIYENGGQLTEQDYCIKEIKKDRIFVSNSNSKISVIKIELNKKSTLLENIFNDLMKENIISKSNVIKDELVDKIIIKNAILLGYELVMEG